MKKSPMKTTLAVIRNIKETQGKVSKAQVLTAQHLHKLSTTPKASTTMGYLGRRYKG